MPTIKELTAKNRELKQKIVEMQHEFVKENERLQLALHKLDDVDVAISGFARPAYGTYLNLAERMGKRDAEIIDISIQVGLLKRVRELAMGIEQGSHEGKVGIMTDPGAKEEGKALTIPPIEEQEDNERWGYGTKGG